MQVKRMDLLNGHTHDPDHYDRFANYKLKITVLHPGSLQLKSGLTQGQYWPPGIVFDWICVCVCVYASASVCTSIMS